MCNKGFLFLSCFNLWFIIFDDVILNLLSTPSVTALDFHLTPTLALTSLNIKGGADSPCCMWLDVGWMWVDDGRGKA